MSLNNTTSWRDWDSQFKRVIWAERAAGSDKSYEWDFAKQVLQQVTGLNPSELSPQHTVTLGDPPKSYRIDFAILKNDRKYAIEVHGFDKTGSGRGPTSQQLTDRNIRERELGQDGWTVLNFSNSEIAADPRQCRLHIEAALFGKVVQIAPKAQPASAAKPRSKAPAEPQKGTRKATPNNTRSAKEQIAKAPEIAQKKSNRGSFTLVGVGIFLLAALAISMNSGARPSSTPEQSQFKDPANPNCQEFTSRAQLDEWVELNPALVEAANLDGDSDGKVCESYNFPDE